MSEKSPKEEGFTKVRNGFLKAVGFTLLGGMLFNMGASFVGNVKAAAFGKPGGPPGPLHGKIPAKIGGVPVPFGGL